MSIECLLEASDLITKVFGPNNLRQASIFQAIAMVHLDIEDHRKAVEYQKKACELYNQVNVSIS